MIGRRVEIKQTGEKGVVTKVIGNCLFVRMDDGTPMSGGKPYFKVLKEQKEQTKEQEENKQ